MASALGAVALDQGVGLLFLAISRAVNKITKLESNPKRLNEFHNLVKPMCDEIEKLNKMLNSPNKEMDMFFDQLKRVEELVRKCSKTEWWNVIPKIIYSNQLVDLEASMLRFLQTVVPLTLWQNSLKVLEWAKNMDEKMNQIFLILKSLIVGGVYNSSRFACLGEVIEHLETMQLKETKNQEKKNHNQEENNRKDANNNMDDSSFTDAVLKINLDSTSDNCPKNVIEDIQYLEGVIVLGYDSDTKMLMVELLVVGKVDRLELKEKVEQKTNKVVQLIELFTLPNEEKWGEENYKTHDHDKKKSSSGFSFSHLFGRHPNQIAAVDEQLEAVVWEKEEEEEEEDNGGKDINTTVVDLKITFFCACNSCPKKVLNRIRDLKGVTVIEQNIGEKLLMVKLKADGKVDPSELRQMVEKNTGRKKKTVELYVAE